MMLSLYSSQGLDGTLASTAYGQRTVPGYAGVHSEADTNATVTVNADPAWRWGGYFYGGDEVDNSADAVMKELEITATYSNLFTSVTGRVFVAETPEAFQYDDDGNLTQDGRFDYTWNGENRLIKAETRDDLPSAVPRVKVEYAYDQQGRRNAAATTVWTNDAWQAVESRAFLYDGWNVIRETVAVGSGSPQSVITNLYTWGLDLSGSLQGAGGIGGLLAANLYGIAAFYFYDANGNVGQLVSPDGDMLAHYEYSPFGETVVSTGPLAEANPFRFSTKPWDDLTGIGYWGYRYYHPDMGRWTSRDPIGERGGLNLLHYVKNNTIGVFDRLGLDPNSDKKAKCESDAVTFMQQNAAWKQKYDTLANPPPNSARKACKAVLNCACCGVDPKYQWGGQCGLMTSTPEVDTYQILICYDKIRSSDYRQAFAHELTHFFDACEDAGEQCEISSMPLQEWKDCLCRRALCAEYRAYIKEGRCNDPDSCWTIMMPAYWDYYFFCKSLGDSRKSVIKEQLATKCNLTGGLPVQPVYPVAP